MLAPTNLVTGSSCLTVTLFLALQCPLPVPDRVVVTLVGNAGFRIQGPRHTLVIDALLEPSQTTDDDFHLFPPARLLASLTARPTAGPPLQLALVTHAHADHFDCGVAASFLRHNPDAVLVGPGDVVDAVRRAAGSRVEKQLVGVAGDADRGALRLTWPGGTATAVPARHSGHPVVVGDHVLYVVEIDGFRVLHVGDVAPSATSFTNLDPTWLEVDVAFLPDWFVTDPEGRDVVTRLIRPEHVVLMHVPVGRAKLAEEWAAQAAKADPRFPPVVVLREPGDATTIGG